MSWTCFVSWLLVIMTEFGGVPVKGSKIHMDDLGTFENTPDFHNLMIRPILVLPHTKEKINTKFLLYTRGNPRNYQLLNARNEVTLTNSRLNTSHPTVFIIHGFVDSHILGKWINTMRDEFLRKDHYNVIIVDWSEGNQFPYYQATANTRVVGAEIAFLVSKLQDKLQLDPKKCHLIGHSLGSHIAGYAGERIKNLGRITALDPAGPLFEGMPSSVTVDPTDAEFVDVIHTDSNNMFRFGGLLAIVIGLGMKQAVGHVDIYPNGGKSQPGCKFLRLPFLSRSFGSDFDTEKWYELAYGALRRTLTCEHERAVELFTASISSEGCKFVGFQCSSWEMFQEGKCTSCGAEGEKCAFMGLHADQYKSHKLPAEKGFFLETSDSEKYCVNRYEVVVRLGNTKANTIDGTIKLKLGGKVIMDKHIHDAEPGEKETYIIHSPIDLLSSKHVNFGWTTSGYFKSHYQIDIESVKITLLTIMDENEQDKHSGSYVPSVDRPVKSKEVIMMNLIQ